MPSSTATSTTVPVVAGRKYQNSASEATIYFSPKAYSTVGAPPWGADYLDLGNGSALTSVDFNGDDQFVFPSGTDFIVDGEGYFDKPGRRLDGKYDNDLDISMARERQRS